MPGGRSRLGQIQRLGHDPGVGLQRPARHPHPEDAARRAQSGHHPPQALGVELPHRAFRLGEAGQFVQQGIDFLPDAVFRRDVGGFGIARHAGEYTSPLPKKAGTSRGFEARGVLSRTGQRARPFLRNMPKRPDRQTLSRRN